MKSSDWSKSDHLVKVSISQNQLPTSESVATCPSLSSNPIWYYDQARSASEAKLLFCYSHWQYAAFVAPPQRNRRRRNIISPLPRPHTLSASAGHDPLPAHHRLSLSHPPLGAATRPTGS